MDKKSMEIAVKEFLTRVMFYQDFFLTYKKNLTCEEQLSMLLSYTNLFDLNFKETIKEMEIYCEAGEHILMKTEKKK